MNTKPEIHLSVEHFYELYGNVPEKYELIDGQPMLKFGETEMMAGGSKAHNRIIRSLIATLYMRLKKTGCEPFGSDMGLKTLWDTVLYPDAAIYCDPRDLEADDLTTRNFAYPSVVFEVLSPSTAKYDQGEKLTRYQSIPSLNAVVIIDPVSKRITLHQRIGPESWKLEKLPQGSDLVLTDPALTLTALEIFDLT
jgi:Uma2 family endonuclease